MSRRTRHSRPEEPGEPPDVAAQDWRLLAATWMTKPAILNGNLLPAGSVVKRTKALRLSRNAGKVMTGAPCITAMLLDVAARFDIETHDLPDALLSASTLDERALAETQLFDWLEKRMVSAIFSFSAVESFANEVVEHAYGLKGFRYIQPRKSGVHASLDFETVQRRLQIEEKIAIIVPQALGVISPKGRTQYNSFKRLKDLRDRIIHCKGRDQSYSNDATLIQELLTPQSRDFAAQMYGLIGYFYEQVPQDIPRWYRLWPWRK